MGFTSSYLHIERQPLANVVPRKNNGLLTEARVVDNDWVISQRDRNQHHSHSIAPPCRSTNRPAEATSQDAIGIR